MYCCDERSMTCVCDSCKRERERERERGFQGGKLDEYCVSSSGGVYTAHNIRHSRDGEKMSEEKGASGRATGRQDGYKRRRIIAVVMMTSCSSSASWEGMHSLRRPGVCAHPHSGGA